uniref:Uncharacterized protein n=1 Tax=Populus trichocarpa TaxID=3694 RepID=A0A2K1X6Q4_POPTR
MLLMLCGAIARGSSNYETFFIPLFCFHQQDLSLLFSSLKIQKKLEETKNSLVDLEEKHRQANITIKQKGFFISNLLKSGEASCN